MEKRLLLEALVLLPMTALALRLVGFRRLQNFLSRISAGESAGTAESLPTSQARAPLVARMVAAASREGLWRGNCLEQSLVLWWLLRREKIPAEFRIGVRKQAAAFEAHAWVESGGAVLNDLNDVHAAFSPFVQDVFVVPLEKD